MYPHGRQSQWIPTPIWVRATRIPTLFGILRSTPKTTSFLSNNLLASKCLKLYHLLKEPKCTIHFKVSFQIHVYEICCLRTTSPQEAQKKTPSWLEWLEIVTSMCWGDPRKEPTSTKVHDNKPKWGSILRPIGNRRSDLYTMTFLFKLPMWDFFTHVYSQQSPPHTWFSFTPHQRTSSPLSGSLYQGVKPPSRAYTYHRATLQHTYYRSINTCVSLHRACPWGPPCHTFVA